MVALIIACFPQGWANCLILIFELFEQSKLLTQLPIHIIFSFTN